MYLEAIMLVMCVEDGLTVGNKVYKKGEVFKLTEVLERDVFELSEEKLARKQRRIYGKPYFRRATSEEIITAHRTGSINPEQLTIAEKRLCFEAMKAQKKRMEETDQLVSVEEAAKFEEEEAFMKAKAEEERKKKKEEEERKDALADMIEEEEKAEEDMTILDPTAKKSRPKSVTVQKSRKKSGAKPDK
jgi:hypothetical protein